MLKWIRKFLQKLAKENNEVFHGQRLDCCDLNRQNNAQKKYKK
ncbi:LDCC motif putative metal-binding protein [Caldicoprobacter algeriensis]